MQIDYLFVGNLEDSDIAVGLVVCRWWKGSGFWQRGSYISLKVAFNRSHCRNSLQTPSVALFGCTRSDFYYDRQESSCTVKI